MAKIANIKKIDLYRLAEVGRTIPKQLHGCTGADFNKPHVLLEVRGRFTINQIKKAVEAEGFDFNRGIDLQIMQRNNWSRQRYNLATVNLNYINIDYRPAWTPHDNSEAYLDNYYRKGDFDEDRKRENAHALIFAQYVADLGTIEKKERWARYTPDEGTRYKVQDIGHAHTTNGRAYISKIEVKALAGTGKIYTIETPFSLAADPVGVEAYIDKSGYYVYTKRDRLQQAAQKLRAERQKAEYNKTHNEAELQQLAQKVDDLKNTMGNALLKAKTAEDVAKIADNMRYYNGLEGVMRDYEKIQNMDAAKTFRSIEDFNKACENVKKQINYIYEKLTAAQWEK